ncbi:coiled-coil domain-containing protein 137 [Uranotaenia lowii]|uniref:coiled-coil domain-containing protein 137 n=1 Tax=Uranotaenia lowii TaxID=190385 RepID=UPI0024783BDD|nr:coiled-coil domain-containing protein 137 [Uranotaenia lowii]
MGQFGPNKPRKIPVPKRHGVRDPIKKLAEREALIKDKVNNPPRERNLQEVSNRFKRFVQLKEESKNPDFARIQQQKSRRKQQSKKSSLHVGDSVVQQLPKETATAFLQRASKIQNDRELEATFSSKYNVEIERNEQTGAIKLRKRKANEIDELLKKKARETKGYKAKSVSKVAKKKLTLSEKKALKKQKINEQKQKEEDRLLEEYQLDTVAFGETVHGPPSLNVKPRRAAQLEGAPRPGTKSLLLHSILNKTNTSEDAADEAQSVEKRKKSKKTPESTKLDLKGKRKKLPIATRMRLDQERQNVVEMYRKLKKSSK